MSENAIQRALAGLEPVTLRVARCGECALGECDRCEDCQWFEGLPGAAETVATVYPVSQTIVHSNGET
jgi:hypothetical protein